MESGPPHLSPVPGTEAVPHHHPHPGVPGMPMPPQMMPMTTPVGLQAIYQACRRLLGGPDPLDYISMYSNPGDPNRGIPAHWHYVSFGLSDLYGDGRVHDELTKMESGPPHLSPVPGTEAVPHHHPHPGVPGMPMPPQMMPMTTPVGLQAIYQACRRLYADQPNPLQVTAVVKYCSESRIQHMLMAEDPLLQSIMSPMGTINFIQIIGVTAEELQAAQRWNGPGILELLRNVPVAGGPWLLTDMRRGETIFEKDPQLQVKSEQIKAELRRGLMGQHGSGAAGFGTGAGADFTDHVNHNTDRERKDSLSSSGSTEEVKPGELQRSQTMDAVHIKINKEAGTLLPLVMSSTESHSNMWKEILLCLCGITTLAFASPVG
uniref:Suppressor of fused protein-like protein n=1 Tax=Branchiostoma floridae TaxID=7739 RepID=C3ZIN8_BRAFL|eukprot:XP_002591562.1 suppressor of fused protein-like protein [Branchiostoma floridae]